MKRYKIIRIYIVEAESRAEAYQLVERSPSEYFQSWLTEMTQPTSRLAKEVYRQMLGTGGQKTETKQAA